MADYCGGESCCPTTEYAECFHCGAKIKRYPLRDVSYWHHVQTGSADCSGGMEAKPDAERLVLTSDGEEMRWQK